MHLEVPHLSSIDHFMPDSDYCLLTLFMACTTNPLHTPSKNVSQNAARWTTNGSNLLITYFAYDIFFLKKIYLFEREKLSACA